MRALFLSLAIVALALPAWAAPALVTGGEKRIEAETAGDVVAIGADIVVAGRVRGDVVAWGGTLRLEPTAVVDGSVLVVGTRFLPSPAAAVHGRTLVWSGLAELAQVVALEEGDVSVDVLERWRWGFRLGAMALWLLIALALAVLLRSPLEAAASRARRVPLVAFLSGATAFLAFVLLALALAALPAGIGALGLGLLAALAIALKVVGNGVAFLVVGRWIGQASGRRVALASPTAITLGLLALGIARWIPGVGILIWGAATLIGFGAVTGLLVGPRTRSVVEIP